MKKIFILIVALIPVYAHAIKDKDDFLNALMPLLNEQAARGEDALYKTDTYTEDFLNGVKEVCRDVQTWCEFYGDIIVPPENNGTDQSFSCKDVRCDCNKAHETDCIGMWGQTLACVRRIPELVDVVKPFDENSITIAKSSCEGLFSRYFRARGGAYTINGTNCEQIEDSEEGSHVKCVASGRAGGTNYSQCCVTATLRDGRTIMPYYSGRPDEGSLGLDDYDDECKN